MFDAARTVLAGTPVRLAATFAAGAAAMPSEPQFTARKRAAWPLLPRTPVAVAEAEIPAPGATSEADATATLEQAEALIDMRAPLVWQIHKLSKAQYLAWVHTPYHYAEEPKVARLFASPLLEPLSKTPWYAVPLVWLPVACCLWSWYVASAGASALGAAGLLVAGLVLWSLIEYSLHRWVFHVDDRLPDWGPALTAHFLIHGIHHRVPMDRFRLVMPPVMTAAIAACVYAVARLVIPLPLVGWDTWHALFGAGMMGYILYDMVHYSQHHSRASPGSYLGRLKRYHMRHHFSGLQGVGFGITSTIWDAAFGTLLPELPRAVVVGEPPRAGDGPGGGSGHTD